MSLSKVKCDPMEYSKGYPCLYGLTGICETYIKNGSSWHIATRKSGAVTYFPRKPQFEYVIILDKKSLQSPSDLYSLDSEFVAFIKRKGLGNYYVEEGGGTEWFYRTCPRSYLDLRLEFLQEKGISILDVLTDDPYPIRDLTTEEEEVLKKEDKIIEKRKQVVRTETLYEKFCRIFLGNKVPRRIQHELWQVFSAIANPEKEIFYKGIVQWPTGCGKTIAILMLIVLAKEYSEKRGEIYRGLFISPKNDILDTIRANFFKLSHFGITVCDGSNAQLSSLTIPKNKHVLVMACHAALLNDNGMKAMPQIDHIHYDEVHRITGDMYFNLLQEMMEKWKTHFLTGTSATPKTSSQEQRRKLAELFGEPLSLLHKCDVDEAVREGWIAKPRFIIRILGKNDDRASVVESFVNCAVDVLKLKQKGGKSIFYIETSIEDVRYAIQYAKNKFPDIQFYSAIDGERTDDKYLEALINEQNHVLFACQRYREGSDIPGLEMTGKLVGNTTAAHNLIQISGRGLRIDYPGKEGWCLIARPSEEGTTVEDVLDSILLEIMDYLGKVDKPLGQKAVNELVKSYFGEMTIEGSRCTLQETIERLQSAYARIQFTRRTPKERYSLIQSHNKELNLTSKHEYLESRSIHPRFVENPQSYFKDCWISWYNFLGVDTSRFPQTKSDWIRVCKELGLTSWTEYKQTKNPGLPVNPGEIYEDYTNWDKEFGVEDEIVW